MSDFAQNGPITTIHDLGTVGGEHLEAMLCDATETYKIGLVLRRAETPGRIAFVDHVIEPGSLSPHS